MEGSRPEPTQMRNAEDTALLRGSHSLVDFRFPPPLPHTLLGAMDSRSVVSKLCHSPEPREALKFQIPAHIYFSEHAVGPDINVMHTHTYLHTHIQFSIKKKKKLPK